MRDRHQRQPRYDWQEAFEFYAGLPVTERTYRRVAEHLGCPKRTVEAAAIRHAWPSRIRAIDAQAAARAEARIVRAREDRVADTLRVIDAARTRFAGQVARADFRLTGSDFVGLVKLEQLLEGQATDNVAVAEVQAGFRSAMAVALRVADEVAAELCNGHAAEFSKRFRARFLPAVNEALAIGGGES